MQAPRKEIGHVCGGSHAERGKQARSGIAGVDGRIASPGAERDQALARLHDLVLRVARREAVRRSGPPRPGGPDPDSLAGRAAADALRAITADLGAIQGDSRFTTWAAKYAVAAVAAAAARAGARRYQAPAQQADDSGWDRLPGRLGLAPRERAGGTSSRPRCAGPSKRTSATSSAGCSRLSRSTACPARCWPPGWDPAAAPSIRRAPSRAPFRERQRMPPLGRRRARRRPR